MGKGDKNNAASADTIIALEVQTITMTKDESLDQPMFGSSSAKQARDLIKNNPEAARIAETKLDQMLDRKDVAVGIVQKALDNIVKDMNSAHVPHADNLHHAHGLPSNTGGGKKGAGR